MTVCLHCGVDVRIQPPKESGCNHAHYPEACRECSDKAAYQKLVTFFDYSKITKEVSE